MSRVPSRSWRTTVPAPDLALIGPYPTHGSLHDGRTGVASYTANLARALDAHGARVVVVADHVAGQPRRSYDGRVRVERAFTRGPLALHHARNAALETDAPLVHVQHENFLYGGPASVPALLPGLAGVRSPLVVTMHQFVEPKAIDSSFTRLHRVRAPARVARLGIAGVQSVIRSCADAVVVHEPVFATAMPGAVVIPHGVERVQRVDRAEARSALGLDDGFVVLCFGFVAPYKGLEAALDAARLTGAAVQLVVAGGEHPRLAGRDDYADDLKVQATENVQFTGRVPDGDVRLWFSAADLALLAYPRPVSSSGALALAFGYRTPTLLSQELATCVGAPTEMSTDRDPARLADRLLMLASNRSALDGLASATAAAAHDRSWPLVAARHLDLYEEVIHGHGAPGRRIRTAQSW
jgi:glycosyltransferase involved in cell wall biosynthesis